MARDQAPASKPEEKKEKDEGQAFFYRVKKWPVRKGEKKAIKPNATAKGRAWENGKEYDHLLLTKGTADGNGAADVREVKVPLTAELCKQVKAAIEKQWSGPNFSQGMEVEFRPVPKTEPVTAAAEQ